MTKIDEILNVISKPRQISHDEPVSQKDWSDVVTSIAKLVEVAKELKDWGCPPIGFKYVRYPRSIVTLDGVEKTLPADLAPEALWPGTVWQQIDEFYAGAFFRVSGGKANDFGSGRQGHALEEHVHKAPGQSFMANPGSHGEINWDADSSDRAYRHRFDASPKTGGASNAQVSSETRPENFTIEIFRRIA